MFYRQATSVESQRKVAGIDYLCYDPHLIVGGFVNPPFAYVHPLGHYPAMGCTEMRHVAYCGSCLGWLVRRPGARRYPRGFRSPEAGWEGR